MARLLKQCIVLFGSGLMVITLSACQTSPSNEDTGRVVGAVIGGVLGSNVGKGSGRTAAIIVGTIAGGYIGGSIGRNMDENDRYRAGQALETNQTNQTSSWHNPDTGYDYTVTPTRTFNNADGPCRDYTTSVVIDGKLEKATGTACRENGQWRIIN